MEDKTSVAELEDDDSVTGLVIFSVTAVLVDGKSVVVVRIDVSSVIEAAVDAEDFMSTCSNSIKAFKLTWRGTARGNPNWRSLRSCH